MAAGASRSPFYAGAFGPDVARQARLSPLMHLGAGDAPNWLLLYDSEHNPGAGYFAERFAVAAQREGLRADATAIIGTGHMRMLQELGRPGDQTTVEVDRFIDRVVGKGAQ
jgi:hypothetical protein